MSSVSAPPKRAESIKETLHEPSRTKQTGSITVIEHVLSRLKDLGITKVFGVAGDFAFPIEDAIVGFLGIDWVGCCNELNASYAADGYARWPDRPIHRGCTGPTSRPRAAASGTATNRVLGQGKWQAGLAGVGVDLAAISFNSAVASLNVTMSAKAALRLNGVWRVA
jgi:hypothetical protein